MRVGAKAGASEPPLYISYSLRLDFAFNFNNLEDLNLVTHFYVVVVFNTDTTFHTVTNFLYVIFKATQRFQFTFGVEPDLMTIAKGLTSGYAPMGAVLMSDEIFNGIADGPNKAAVVGHGQTYSAHPVSAAVALEVIKIYEESMLAHARYTPKTES